MRILGISPEVWISSAALIEDGKIIAAAPEERFNREKMSKIFPAKAIDYCLKEAGITMDDIDYVAMCWNPGTHLKSASIRYSKAIRWRGEYLYSIPNYLLTHFPFPEVEHMEQVFHFKKKKLSIFYINHHLSHAANAFFLSPFKEAAILSVDGRGENETCVLAKGSGNTIEKTKSIYMPHSLGLLYGTITEFLGFTPHTDEWKVMALASYGKPNNEYYRKLKKIVKNDNGEFELDLSYFAYYLFDKHPTLYSTKLMDLLGRPRVNGERIDKKHIEIAAALQRIFEESTISLLERLYKETRSKNLVFSGGCAMNSVFNGKILDATPFKDLFISSCPDDSGTSLGAALYLNNCILGNKTRKVQLDNYWGPSFSDKEIKETINKYKVKHTKFRNIENMVAELVSKGKLVGWFQGKMEFGQRALGNRSILADPRNPKSKDLVNKAVKYRESFRPFAPSIIEKYAEDFFEIPNISSAKKVPFMERVYKIKKEKRKLIPAVCHVDGTGRLQTVSKSTNPRFYKLIGEFKKMTGIPVILNTSFNLNGEPMVCSPRDAIRTFVCCGLDYLAMGDYLISKEK